VPLSIQQEKYYKLLKKEMLLDISGHEVSAANAAVALNKLLQISAGCVYAENGDVVEFDITNRVNELLSVIDETAHKVIVFVMFRHTIEVVQKHLQDAGHTVDIIHGGISANKRAEIFNDFQTKPDPRILVIQPQAASHGVTLHAANVVVWFGMTLSLETYLQANARIHRQGQVNHCTIVHLIGSKVEKKVLSVLEGKNTAQTKLLDLFKDVIGG
jgi:SNF2 family DNA or RNA helicase